MQLPSPTYYPYRDALDRLGRSVIDGWDGSELRARKLLAPTTARAVQTVVASHAAPQHMSSADIVKAIRQYGGEPSLVAVIYVCSPEEMQGWPSPESIEYQVEYASWGRFVAARSRLCDMLKYGYAEAWIKTPAGDRIDLPPHAFEEPPTVRIYDESGEADLLTRNSKSELGKPVGKRGRLFVDVEGVDDGAKQADQPVVPEDTTRQTSLSVREKGKADTQAKYQRWYDKAQAIKVDPERTHPMEPGAIAGAVARHEGVNPSSVKRRLNELFPEWATYKE